MFPVIRLPAFSCLCLYCVILSRLLSIPKAKPGMGGRCILHTTPVIPSIGEGWQRVCPCSLRIGRRVRPWPGGPTVAADCSIL